MVTEKAVIMNFKEALFFIARCTTISKNEKNRIWVKNKIAKKEVCWDKVIIQSTTHYMLPALYGNLKRNHLLFLLPIDLVKFMIHISDLNRSRNNQIILQAKELNTLLLKHNITPIFIKGTGFILQELYDSISDRMIGDIDFIVPKKDTLKAYTILKNNGYKQNSSEVFNDMITDFRHLPRLIKKDKIAAIEIHYELTSKRFRKEFSYKKVSKNIIKNCNNLHFLSYNDQISLTIIATQINNGESIYLKKIRLRNTYDVYLLSKKENTLKAIKSFKKLFNPLNNYLAISKYVLKDNSIKTKNTTASFKAIKTFNKSFNVKKHSIIKRKIMLLKLAFIDSGLRKKLLNRVKRKSWRTQKLIEFGLKKK